MTVENAVEATQGTLQILTRMIAEFVLEVMKIFTEVTPVSVNCLALISLLPMTFYLRII